MPQEIVLASSSNMPHSLQWSPDGAWIAYVMEDAQGNDQIHKLPADGGMATTLTSLPLR